MALAHAFKAIPHQVHPASLPAPVVCIHCFLSLGAPRNQRERQKLESKHLCQEKLQAKKPAVSIPFN